MPGLATENAGPATGNADPAPRGRDPRLGNRGSQLGWPAAGPSVEYKRQNRSAASADVVRSGGPAGLLQTIARQMLALCLREVSGGPAERLLRAATQCPAATATQIVDLWGAKIIQKNCGWPLRKLDLSLAAPRVKGRKSLGACLKGSGKPVYNRSAPPLCDAVNPTRLHSRSWPNESKARIHWTQGPLRRDKLPQDPFPIREGISHGVQMGRSIEDRPGQSRRNGYVGSIPQEE